MAKSTTPKSIDIELSSTGGSGTQAVDPLEESYDTTKNDDDSMEESQTSSVETLRRAYSASVLSEIVERQRWCISERTQRNIRTCMEFPTISWYATAYAGFSVFLVLLISLMNVNSTRNMSGFIDPSSMNFNPSTYDSFNLIFTIFFSFDLLVRFVVADTYCCYFQKQKTTQHEHKSYSRDTKKKFVPFFRDPFTWFDIFSVCPQLISTLARQYNPYSPPHQAIQLMGIFRIFRIFTTTRHHFVSKIMFKTLNKSLSAILMLLLMLLCFISMLAILLMYLEPCWEVQSCEFEDGFNAWYYLAITMTTVGFGDKTPQNAGGKFIGVLVMIAGATYMAMPLAIIGASFEEVYEDYNESQIKTNHHWAQKQLRKLQQVTRKERTARSMKLKDLVSKDLYLLKNQSKSLEFGSAFTMSRTKKTRDTILRDLCRAAGQLAVDVKILFDLKHHQQGGQNLRRPSLTHARTNSKAFLMHARVARRSVVLLNENKKKEKKKREQEKKRKMNDMRGSSIFLTGRQKRQELHVQQQMLNLLAQGHEEVVRLHKIHEQECHTISKAVRHSACHDRVYLLVKVPQSSSWARVYYNTNHIMAFLSLLLLFLETVSLFQVFGEDSPACHRVIRNHCHEVVSEFCSSSLVETSEDTIACRDARAGNAGCFPNATSEYPGCFTRSGVGCGFGKKEWFNVTCSNLLEPPFDPIWLSRPNKLCGRLEEKECKDQDERCHWNTQAKQCEDRVEQEIVNVCARVQCIANQPFFTSGNYEMTNARLPIFFFICEVCFAAWFLIDIILGIFANQNVHSNLGYLFWFDMAPGAEVTPFHSGKQTRPTRLVERLKNWRSRLHYDFDNCVHFVATLVQIIDVLSVAISLDGPRYTVYGNYWGDPFNIRIFRIAIPLRFAIMQKDVFRILSSTAARVIHKLVIPYLFFFVMALIFGTAFYIVESGDLFIDCHEGDYAPNYPYDRLPTREVTGCRWCPQPYGQSNAADVTDPWTKNIDSATDYDQVYLYNRSCTSYIKAPIEGNVRTTGVDQMAIRSTDDLVAHLQTKEIKVLKEPLIFDMWDAIWTMIVTMTTVGCALIVVVVVLLSHVFFVP